MTDLETNLRWACQALNTLNASGFPSVAMAEVALNHRGLSPANWEKVLLAAAKVIVDGTRHLDGMPAVVALRASVETCAA